MPNNKIAKDLAHPMTHPEWGREFFSGPAKKAEDNKAIVNISVIGGEVRHKIDNDNERSIFDLYLAPEGQEFSLPLSIHLLLKRGGFFIHDFDLYSKRPQEK